MVQGLGPGRDVAIQITDADRAQEKGGGGRDPETGGGLERGIEDRVPETGARGQDLEIGGEDLGPKIGRGRRVCHLGTEGGGDHGVAPL